MNKPHVSIIMPTYNSSRYLLESVHSILNQTYDNWELIIVDDGSTDNTYQLLEPYLNNRKIKYIKQQNQGPAAARNKGINIADGELIALLDADDIWDYKKLEYQCAEIGKKEDTIVLTSIIRFVDDLNDLGFRTDPPCFENNDQYLNELLLLSDSRMANFFSILAPKYALLEVGLYDQTLKTAEDWDLWLRLAFTKKYTFRNVPQPLVYYRKYAESLTRRYHFTKTFYNQLCVLDKILNLGLNSNNMFFWNKSKIEKHIFFFEKSVAHKCYLEGLKIWWSALNFRPFYTTGHIDKLLKWPLRLLFNSLKQLNP